MMSDDQKSSPSRMSKWGWGILLVISALLILNGVSWLFTGSDTSLSYPLRIGDVPEEEFIQTYPTVVNHVAINEREKAIWFMAFGLLAFLVALEGFRNGSRWAWYAAWVIVITFIALGVNYLVGTDDLGFANVGRILIGAVALIGVLLAHTRGG